MPAYLSACKQGSDHTPASSPALPSSTLLVGLSIQSGTALTCLVQAELGAL